VGGVKEQMHILGVELNVSRAETALLQVQAAFLGFGDQITGAAHTFYPI
jgi:hypothetical protein